MELLSTEMEATVKIPGAGLLPVVDAYLYGKVSVGSPMTLVADVCFELFGLIIFGGYLEISDRASVILAAITYRSSASGDALLAMVGSLDAAISTSGEFTGTGGLALYVAGSAMASGTVTVGPDSLAVDGVIWLSYIPYASHFLPTHDLTASGYFAGSTWSLTGTLKVTVWSIVSLDGSLTVSNDGSAGPWASAST